MNSSNHIIPTNVEFWPMTSQYSDYADPTVDGMIVSGLLKCERSHVGMQKHISMCIASVNGKCYDSARARGERKLSDTEEVNSMSFRYCYEVGLRFAWSRYANGF